MSWLDVWERVIGGYELLSAAGQGCWDVRPDVFLKLLHARRSRFPCEGHCGHCCRPASSTEDAPGIGFLLPEAAGRLRCQAFRSLGPAPAGAEITRGVIRVALATACVVGKLHQRVANPTETTRFLAPGASGTAVAGSSGCTWVTALGTKVPRLLVRWVASANRKMHATLRLRQGPRSVPTSKDGVGMRRSQVR